MGDSRFPLKEEELLSFWDESHIFEKSLSQRKNGKLFSFFDGPPFATGLPHYGHILGSVIKDVVGRYWTMKGYYVPRRWGWDCHGLPIENIVEQELNLAGKKKIEELGVDVFNTTCREKVLTYVDEWGKMVRRMARWVDFDNSYKTMDSTYMESVWWAVGELWNKGHIYEGKKVLLYCPRCETPISNFEVAMDNSYKDVSEDAVTITFILKGDHFPLNTSLLAWTTTPWTLPSNVALAVNETITYVVAKQGDTHFILSKNRLEMLQGEYEVVKELQGKDLIGVSYEPLYIIEAHKEHEENAHKVYGADFVTDEDGTGIVHIATAYGEEDYNLNLKHSLPVVSLLNERGIFTEQAPSFIQGMYFSKASPEVITDLESRTLLYHKALHTHQYPFCWRCSTALYYSALPAWFIRVQDSKDSLLKYNEDISWYPEHLKHGRFENGILSAPDWNISRNRYWATPLPFWKCENVKCENAVCVGSLKELQDNATNYNDIYASKDIRNVDLHKPYIDSITLKCKECGSYMRRVSEVIDCWVESASMPFAELHYPFENKEEFEQRFPADFVAEYIAQTRAWFYVMHVMSSLLFNKAPFKHVVVTGNVLNEKGEKLSKSKKNAPDPWEIIDTYGVDALRFYLMSSVVMRGENLFFSDKGIDEAYKKIILITNNVLSFYNLYKKENVQEHIGVPLNELHVLDQWMVARLHYALRMITSHLDGYDSVSACDEISSFIDELSTWYLRRSRERFKEGEGLEIFGYVLLQLSKMIAPILPFLSEHVYKEVGGNKESVHLEDWPEYIQEYENNEILEGMKKVRMYATKGLFARNDVGIKTRQPLSELAIGEELDEALQTILKDEVNVKHVAIDSSLEEGTVRLSTELTPELEEEGIMRELIRKLNELRKTLGLTIHDRTQLRCRVKEGEILETIFKKYTSDILRGTLSVALEKSDSESLPHTITLEKGILEVELVKE